MLEHIIGIVLLGLGLQSPLSSQQVLGTQSNKQITLLASNDSGHGSDDDNNDTSEDVGSSGGSSGTSGSSGSSGATGVSTSTTESETHTSSTTAPSMIDGIPTNISKERRDLYKKEMERRKAEIDAKRKAMEKELKQKREALKTSFSEAKDVYRAEKRGLDDLRLHMEEERNAFLDSIKTRMEQSGSEREAQMKKFKDKVTTFKDQMKKTKVEEIQAKITSFVTKRISVMTTNLAKMMDLVGLNKTQVIEKANGKDTNSFDTAAAAALTAINTAKDKVTELSSKQYVVTVNSESTVKTDVETVRKSIETDLKAANELIKNARITVSKMITERAKLLGEPVPDAVIQ